MSVYIHSLPVFIFIYNWQCCWASASNVYYPSRCYTDLEGNTGISSGTPLREQHEEQEVEQEHSDGERREESCVSTPPRDTEGVDVDNHALEC